MACRVRFVERSAEGKRHCSWAVLENKELSESAWSLRLCTGKELEGRCKRTTYKTSAQIASLIIHNEISNLEKHSEGCEHAGFKAEAC